MQFAKKRVFLLLSMICLLVSLSACNTIPEGNPADGLRWYTLNRCNGCHGEDSLGGKGPAISKGPVLAGTSLSFNKFRKKLRAPHSGIMPAYSADKLSDKDAGEIYLWLLEQKK